MPDTRVLVLLAESAITLLIMLWIRRSSRGAPESWRYMIGILGGGALAAIIVAAVQMRYLIQAVDLTPQVQLTQSFLSVVTEELAKYMVALIAITNSRHLYRLSSAITYLILVGLGFALMEDVLYLFIPAAPSIPRLLSFLVHAGTGAVLGYALGRYRFGLVGYRYLFAAFSLAVILHWSFNLGVGLLETSEAILIAAAVNIFVSSRIFILHRRTLLEEYRLERELFSDVEPTKLLNTK